MQPQTSGPLDQPAPIRFRHRLGEVLRARSTSVEADQDEGSCEVGLHRVKGAAETRLLCEDCIAKIYHGAVRAAIRQFCAASLAMPVLGLLVLLIVSGAIFSEANAGNGIGKVHEALVAFNGPPETQSAYLWSALGIIAAIEVGMTVSLTQSARRLAEKTAGADTRDSLVVEAHELRNRARSQWLVHGETILAVLCQALASTAGVVGAVRLGMPEGGLYLGTVVILVAWATISLQQALNQSEESILLEMWLARTRQKELRDRAQQLLGMSDGSRASLVVGWFLVWLVIGIVLSVIAGKSAMATVTLCAIYALGTWCSSTKIAQGALLETGVSRMITMLLGCAFGLVLSLTVAMALMSDLLGSVETWAEVATVTVSVLVLTAAGLIAPLGAAGVGVAKNRRIALIAKAYVPAERAAVERDSLEYRLSTIRVKGLTIAWLSLSAAFLLGTPQVVRLLAPTSKDLGPSLGAVLSLAGIVAGLSLASVRVAQPLRISLRIGATAAAGLCVFFSSRGLSPLASIYAITVGAATLLILLVMLLSLSGLLVGGRLKACDTLSVPAAAALQAKTKRDSERRRTLYEDPRVRMTADKWPVGCKVSGCGRTA